MSHATKPGPAAVQTAGAGLTDSLVVSSRFCGPPGSSNGGYVCGSALLGPGGQVLAAAQAVWLTVPRPVPPRAGGGSS